MKRYEIINHFIKKIDAKNYLEIGVRDGECFQKIICDNKIGVDPNPTSNDTTHVMTSDDFFSSVDSSSKFDVVFIDGLHLDYQVDKDVQNSLKFLSKGGVIILHDCNPPTKLHALEAPVYSSPTNGEWNGTVYLSLIKLRLYRDDVVLTTVDTDWGVGILTEGKSKKINTFPNDALNWDFFNENRKEILDLISVEKFKELF